MARTRYQFLQDGLTPYFLTDTVVNWLPLFGKKEVADIIIDSLRFMISQQRITLYAYVIMENHLHLVASAEDLSVEIKRFKSFTARKCIDFYQKDGNRSILRQLASEKLAFKKDRDYQFWQEGSHPQLLENEEMMWQKVQYIHHNPVRRGYVDLPEHWRYSSARDYEGIEGLLPVALGV